MKTSINFKRMFSVILCALLIAAMAIVTSGCSGSEIDTPKESVTSAAEVLGEGKTQFFFNVVEENGNITPFEIRTDKETVGEALIALGLIEGEEGDYGIYVKKVNGITADFSETGTYWAFYVGDSYAQTGAELTEIVSGETYSFRVEKG